MAHFFHLNILLQSILKNYFFDSRCLYIFTDNYNQIEIKAQIPIIYFSVGDNNYLNSNSIFDHHGCQDILIFHKNAADLFMQIEKLIKLTSYRFNSRKYIIVENRTSKIFTVKELDDVSDFLVIVTSTYYSNDDRRVLFSGQNLRNETYQLLTHASSGNSRKPIILDKWFSINSSFLCRNNLFPNKLFNQNGKELNIGTIPYEPYSIISADNRTYSGTEGYFILEFVKKCNITPVFHNFGAYNWGDIYENGTGAGLLGNLANNTVHIGYAALYAWESYHKFLDYSKPLGRSGVTLLVPAPQVVTGWLTPLHPFSLNVWMVVLSIFSLSVAVINFLPFRNDNKNISNFEDRTFVMLTVYLSQSVGVKIKGRLMKYFMVINFFYILVLCSSYLSYLNSIMTVPRYNKAINTVKDFVSSELQWGGVTDGWLVSILNVEDEDYKTMINRYFLTEKDELIQSSKFHNFATPIERLTYGHYTPTYIDPDSVQFYRLMQKDIYWDTTVFMVQKSSVFLPLLDNLILRIREAGLPSYWENQVVSEFMDMSLQRRIIYYTYHFHEHEIQKLKWVHVQGVFGILLIGYFLAIITLLIENLISSINKKSTVTSIDI